MSEIFVVVRDNLDYYGTFDNLAAFSTRAEAAAWCRRMRAAAGEPLWDDPDDYDQHYKVRSVRCNPTEIADSAGRFPDERWFKPWPEVLKK